MATPKAEKSRYFVFIVYEESAPEDWRERLKRETVQRLDKLLRSSFPLLLIGVIHMH